MNLIVTNCFFYLLSLAHPTYLPAQQDPSPFIVTSRSLPGAGQAPAIYNFHCQSSGGRISLSWEAGDNEHTERFELEKSRDGKHFRTAALLFGTDKAGIDQYRFYEKKNRGKVFYRLKLIRKDQQVEYSTVVLPTKNKPSTDL